MVHPSKAEAPRDRKLNRDKRTPSHPVSSLSRADSAEGKLRGDRHDHGWGRPPIHFGHTTKIICDEGDSDSDEGPIANVPAPTAKLPSTVSGVPMTSPSTIAGSNKQFISCVDDDSQDFELKDLPLVTAWEGDDNLQQILSSDSSDDLADLSDSDMQLLSRQSSLNGDENNNQDSRLLQPFRAKAGPARLGERLRSMLCMTSGSSDIQDMQKPALGNGRKPKPSRPRQPNSSMFSIEGQNGRRGDDDDDSSSLASEDFAYGQSSSFFCYSCTGPPKYSRAGSTSTAGSSRSLWVDLHCTIDGVMDQQGQLQAHDADLHMSLSASIAGRLGPQGENPLGNLKKYDRSAAANVSYIGEVEFESSQPWNIFSTSNSLVGIPEAGVMLPPRLAMEIRPGTHDVLDASFAGDPLTIKLPFLTHVSLVATKSAELYGVVHLDLSDPLCTKCLKHCSFVLDLPSGCGQVSHKLKGGRINLRRGINGDVSLVWRAVEGKVDLQYVKGMQLTFQSQISESGMAALAKCPVQKVDVKFEILPARCCPIRVRAMDFTSSGEHKTRGESAVVRRSRERLSTRSVYMMESWVVR